MRSWVDSETFDPERIFNIRSDEEFVAAAIDLFRFQAKAVPPYAEYVRLLGVDPERVSSLEEIPFLPISFFKSREVYGARKEPEKIFTSSSTTGQTPARHYVADLKLYERAFTEAFEHFYGPVGEVSIFALLPGYLEREGSSLIYMVDHLIRQGANCLNRAVHELDRFRDKPKTLRECCVELHDIETQADIVYALFIKQLFEEEKDAIEIIKIKDIMETLEETTDAVDHVGKLLANLIVKYA